MKLTKWLAPVLALALLAGLGCRAEDSLMVGNDPVCDCQGAAAAGMDSVFIRTPQSPKGRAVLPKNCRRIRALAEIGEETL